MHIDDIQEIKNVDGYKIVLVGDQENTTKLISYDYAQIEQLG